MYYVLLRAGNNTPDGEGEAGTQAAKLCWECYLSTGPGSGPPFDRMMWWCRQRAEQKPEGAGAESYSGANVSGPARGLPEVRAGVAPGQAPGPSQARCRGEVQGGPGCIPAPEGQLYWVLSVPATA